MGKNQDSQEKARSRSRSPRTKTGVSGLVAGQEVQCSMTRPGEDLTGTIVQVRRWKADEDWIQQVQTYNVKWPLVAAAMSSRGH